MTWTWDSSLPTDRDKVRLEIGDVSATASPTLSDEEIDNALAQREYVVDAAILCCGWLIARNAVLVTQGVGAVSVQYDQRIAHYRELISRLRLRARALAPVAGGISEADKLVADEDTDRVAPTFKRGMFDRKY